MTSNFVPPSYKNFKSILEELRNYYFQDSEKLSLFLAESETKKFIAKGTLLNPDYKEINKKELKEHQEAQYSKWMEPTLTKPHYQEFNETIYTFSELDDSEEDMLRAKLQSSQSDDLKFNLRKIVVSIVDKSTDSEDLPLSFSIKKTHISKTAVSEDEFKKLIRFYLVDKKIKKFLRNKLCSDRSNDSDHDFSAWVPFDQKIVRISEESWVDDRFWYRLLADGRITISGKSTTSHINGWTDYSDYNVTDQLLFFKGSNIRNHMEFLDQIKKGTLSDWDAKRFSFSFSFAKELTSFVTECFAELQKDQPVATNTDSSQSSLKEEVLTPVETKEPEQKKPTLVDLDLHHTPWLELLNHIFDVHGVDGIRTVSKKILENTMNDYIQVNDLPIDSKTDVEYLAKFIRKPEQKMGKNYYDQLNKEKNQKKSA